MINLTVADADENAVGKYLAKDFVQLPKGDDPRFISALLDICKEKKIQLVHPLVTKELFPLSINKKKLEAEGIKVLVSSEEAINIANNKSACYQFLQSKGIAVPRFFVVNTVEEFIHAAFELGMTYKAMGSLDEAKEWLTKARDSYTGFLIETLVHLRIHGALGKIKDSEKALKRA